MPWARAVSLHEQAAYGAGRWVHPRQRVQPTFAPSDETVRAWSARWLAARRAAGLASVDDDAGRLAHHVLPLLGDERIATVARARVEDVRDALDAKVAAAALAAATALKAWGVVTKMFGDACRAKDRALRVRADNPCTDVLPPERGPERVGPVLYPAEFLALLACPRVPLRWRRLFSLAVYTYARAGELAALAWDAVDLARGTLHLHAALDADGALGTTKTATARRIPIEPTLRPFLHALHAEQGGAGRLVRSMPRREDLAAYLRTCLGYAGCARPELFADDATRRPITYHDLRASGLTWCAARGDAAFVIQARAGHASVVTTQGYVRLAEDLGELGAVFPALPLGALGFAAR